MNPIISALLSGFGAGTTAAPYIQAGIQNPTKTARMSLLGSMGSNLKTNISNRPVVNPEFLRPDYSGAGERARRFQEYKTGRDIPGANTDYSSRLNAVATSTPGERAYQEEKARVAQLTEQDPLFKKYKIGELTKAYNEAKGDERERIGLQIWATTNPKLAERLRPGQVGYQTSAALKGSQVFGTDVPGITETMYQQASQAAGLPSNISFTASDPRFSNAFGTGLNAEQFGVSAPGTMPPSMIGADLFKRDFDIPSSKDLKQTELALLKRAIESRIK